ncbi:MAG: carboxylating nicotinate-nucleotide diphosphorylase [Promethearchaeota archaeon]
MEKNIPYKFLIKDRIKKFILEDVQFDDVTSEIIPRNQEGNAKIIAKEQGILAGIIEAETAFDLLGCNLQAMKNEGDVLAKNTVVASIKGQLTSILLVERTALNLIMHLSGIASQTRKFQEIIEKNRINPVCMIAATRKTTPGLRIMEKRAVKIGGGDTHRWSLDDMILLKDTHRTFFNGDLVKMIRECRKKASFSKKIELEVENLEDAITAAKAGVDIIMLDNMTPDDITKTIKTLESKGLRKNVTIECSGNVTIENVADYAKTGVDIISTSAITLKAKPIDFSLELEM